MELKSKPKLHITILNHKVNGKIKLNEAPIIGQTN